MISEKMERKINYEGILGNNRMNYWTDFDPYMDIVYILFRDSFLKGWCANVEKSGDAQGSITNQWWKMIISHNLLKRVLEI